MIEFLLIIVECHHPGGVPEDSAKAYAYNWADWKKILMKLNHFANKEVENARNKYAKTKSLPSNVLKFIVEVYNQVCTVSFRIFAAKFFEDIFIYF